jgi:hypothetical protein
MPPEVPWAACPSLRCRPSTGDPGVDAATGFSPGPTGLFSPFYVRNIELYVSQRKATTVTTRHSYTKLTFSDSV